MIIVARSRTNENKKNKKEIATKNRKTDDGTRSTVMDAVRFVVNK